jgi:hypothetical protein
MASDQQLPEQVRDQTISYLKKFLDSEIDLEAACRKARKLSRVKWFRQLLDELVLYDQPHLPTSPQDSPNSHEEVAAAAHRTILYLRSGRVYEDGSGPIASLLGGLFAFVMLGGFIALMSLGLIKTFLFQAAWIDLAINAMAIAIAVCLGVLFCFYVVGNFFASVHIFRVRVLRQDLTPDPDTDSWPYLEREEYERDKRELTSSL